MPARRPTYISTITSHENCRNEREADHHHAHGQNRGDRQRIVFKHAELCLLGHLRGNANTGVEDLGWRRRSAAGTNLIQAVDHCPCKRRSLVENEGKKADEHDAADEFGKPAVQRGSLKRQPHCRDADFDPGEDPEQRLRRVHDGGFPAFCSCGNLIFQLGQDLSLLSEGWGCKHQAEQACEQKHLFEITFYHRGRISWPFSIGGSSSPELKIFWRVSCWSSVI